MISFPICKINLGLNIISKRNDGYHEISSVMYPVELFDVLEVVRSDAFQFSSAGMNIPGDPSDNLCVKAYKILAKDFDLAPVHIHLYKNIPMGAGLGGGSADGAYTLKLINDLFELKLTNEQLKVYAAALGSDCAFFIESIPQLASGRGELLKPLNLSLHNKTLVLINDGTHISTAEAYGGVTPAQSKLSVEEIIQKPITDWRKLLKNDFEKGVFTKHPQLKSYVEKLYESGAEYAAMTGSGSTVFGLFNGPPNLDPSLRNISGFVKEIVLK